MPTPPATSSRERAAPSGREIAGVAGLALAALALRLIHWSQTSVMFNDGPRFLIQAGYIFDGEWRRALGDAYHPLYAFATACVRLALDGASPSPSDWERAGVAVSIAAGVGAVLAFYGFLRSAFGQPAAWIGAGLLACNPYSVEFSSDVQSDGLHQALFLAGVAFAWGALRQARPALAGWAGVCSGLAYLTRPEGLGLAFATAGVAALQVVTRRWRLRTALPWAAALVAGFLIVTGPYLVALRVNAGEWTLTQKKSLRTLAGISQEAGVMPSVGLGIGAEVPFTPNVMEHRHEYRERARNARAYAGEQPPGRWKQALAAVGEVLHTTTSALRPEIVVFAAIGIAIGWGLPGLRGQFILAVMVLYWAAAWLLAYNYGYLSRRHTLTPTLLLLGYAAAAVPALADLARRRARGGPAAGLRASRAVTGGVLLLLLALGVGKTLRPQRASNAGERAAADWIQALDLPSVGPVAAGKRRVAYYAGAPWFPLRKMPEGAPLEAALRSNGVRFVVADEKDVEAYPDLSNPEAAGFVVRFHSESEDGSTTVFELRDGEGG
jgi:4-amino-4-deoxy-L-arabinose transferase-like glycosyltransferase